MADKLYFPVCIFVPTKKQTTDMKYLLFLALFLVSISLSAQESILVQLQANTSIEAFEKSHSFDLSFQKTLFRAINLHAFTTTSKVDMAAIEHHPLVKRVRTHQALELRYTEPDDPDFGVQWALNRIEAPRAWDISTGGTTSNGDRIVVAVLETGFDTGHEDIAANIWENSNEIPDNGIDDDDNGYIDDINGWNFKGRSGFDFNPHGQSVAGIIGGTGNNGVGGTGVNWDLDLLLLQYRTNSFGIEDIFTAYDYIYEMRHRYNESKGAEGAFIVASNASWGLRGNVPCGMNDMWNDAYEKLGEVGVLTAASVKNEPIDIDELGDTPSGCPSNYIISVMNTDILEQKANTSAFGAQTVDMAAPGVEIFTTAPNDQYDTNFGGASAAAPHVAGAIALLYSMPCETLLEQAISAPAEAALLVKQAILEGVDKQPNLLDNTLSGGRLNLYKSMLTLQSYCNPVPGEKLELYSVYPNPAQNTLTLSYEAAGFDEMEVRIFDTLGRLVYKSTTTPCCQKVNRVGVSIADLAVATYFIQIVQGTEQVSKRFVKF